MATLNTLPDAIDAASNADAVPVPLDDSTRAEPGEPPADHPDHAPHTIDQGRIANGAFAALTREAPYKTDDPRASNEDGLLALQLGDDTAVLAVADGVGGHALGHIASSLMLEHLEQALTVPGLPIDNLREPILNAIEACNAELLARGQGSATTTAIVEIQGETIRPYHVGDSTILVTGQRGVQKYQSVSHSPVGLGIEAGLLDEDAATRHEERHWILNLVGSSEMRIEVGAPLPLAQFDTLLICSDGLTDNLPVADIVETVRKGALPKAVESLAHDCQAVMHTDAGHPDDLTVVLYRRGVKR